jgi:hypothetical protein
LGLFGCQLKTKECRGRPVFEACTITVDIARTGHNDFDYHPLPVTMASRDRHDNGFAQFEAGVGRLKKVSAQAGLFFFSISASEQSHTRYADLSGFKEQ